MHVHMYTVCICTLYVHVHVLYTMYQIQVTGEQCSLTVVHLVKERHPLLLHHQLQAMPDRCAMCAE